MYRLKISPTQNQVSQICIDNFVIENLTGGSSPSGSGNGGYYAEVLSVNDYYAFGGQKPQRSYNSAEYRFGFNGMETDNELKGQGNSYDFGARMYDARLGRFMSVDPLFKAFAFKGVYDFANNNPIYNIDAEGKSGKAYKTDIINKATGNPVLAVVSNVYVYGAGVTQERIHNIQEELSTQYNNCGEYFTYTDADGITYDVVFAFNVIEITEEQALERIYEDNAENNYVRIDSKENMKSETGTATVGKDGSLGGNIADWTTEDLDKDINVASHEMNHGYGGEDHPNAPSGSGKQAHMGTDENVDITIPQNTLYTGTNTQVDITNRSVTQENITYILDKVEFNTNTQISMPEGDVGVATIPALQKENKQ